MNQPSGKMDYKSPIPTRAILFVYDLLVYVVVAYFLFSVYQSVVPLDRSNALLRSIVSFVCIFFIRIIWGIYAQVWRYGGIQSYIRMILSDGCAFVVLFLTENFLPFFADKLGFIYIPTIFARTLSVSVLTLLGSLVLRMCYRYIYKCCPPSGFWSKLLRFVFKVFSFNQVELHADKSGERIKVAIVGAGRMGVSLVSEIRENAFSPYVPCCFIDRDRKKIGRQIAGLPVFDERNIHSLSDRFDIQEVIIAIPTNSPDERRDLYSFYKSNGYQVKVYDYPAFSKVGDGRLQLRDFSVEELLFRKPLDVLDEQVKAYYRDKTILITGGGGSIGSELCRQIASMQPKLLVILDVYENGAYDVQQELRLRYGKELHLQVEILSVCNRVALEEIFKTYHPNVVLHAAAHKHVPLMEHNCIEAVENNVLGTLNTVELSEKYKADRFMMVSTDKAVNPTNIMGATKRMCEMIVQSHSRSSAYTTFSATRFGNVLGSAGSVIPLFKRQIANGGPVTLTDKRIIRYFMTIPEASQLVLQSASMAKNGELFVLDMGKPIKILDLAENMIRLSGYIPYRDIDIKEIGLRPGEKLYEELLVKTEELDKTENEMIFVERDTPITPDELRKKLDILQEAIHSRDNEKMRSALHDVVPTFRTPEEVNSKAEKAEEMRKCMVN